MAFNQLKRVRFGFAFCFFFVISVKFEAILNGSHTFESNKTVSNTLKLFCCFAQMGIAGKAIKLVWIVKTEKTIKRRSKFRIDSTIDLVPISTIV